MSECPLTPADVYNHELIRLSDVLIQPVAQELQSLPGDHKLISLKCPVELRQLRHELSVLGHVDARSGIEVLVHQFFFVLKVDPNIAEEAIKELAKHIFAGAVAHGVQQFLGQGEQCFVLPVDLGVRQHVPVVPREQHHDRYIGIVLEVM
jgi:hypothetical protein